MVGLVALLSLLQSVALLSLLQSVALLSLLQSVVSLQSGCEPVEEGKDLIIHCAGEGDIDQTRNIYWSVNYLSGLEEDIVDCYHFHDRQCESQNSDRYTATIERRENYYNSSLLIPQISYEKNGANFTCTVDDFSDLKTQLECRVKVFRSAEGVTCRVKQLRDDNLVSVICEVQDAFPSIKCEVDDNTAIIPPRVMYLKHCPKQERRCGHTCSINFYLSGPSAANFAVKVRADGDHGQAAVRKLSVPSVDLVQVPKLAVMSGDEDKVTDVCSGSRAGTYRCHGESLPQQATFNWCLSNSLGQREAKLVKSERANFVNGATEAESELILTISYFKKFNIIPVDVKVTCKLSVGDDAGVDICNEEKHSRVDRRDVLDDDEDGDFERLIENSFEGSGQDIDEDSGDYGDNPYKVTVTTQEVRWPPKTPPRMTYNNGLSLGASLELEAGENRTVTCNIDGGRPVVSKINLTCWTANRNKTLIQVTAPGKSISFTVFGNVSFHRALCICQGDHVTNCYDLKTELDLTVTGEGQVSMRRSQSWKGVLDSDSAIKLIILNFVILVVVAVIIAIAFYLKRHWEDLYNYYITYKSSRSSAATPYASIQVQETNAPPLPPPRQVSRGHSVDSSPPNSGPDAESSLPLIQGDSSLSNVFRPGSTPSHLHSGDLSCPSNQICSDTTDECSSPSNTLYTPTYPQSHHPPGPGYMAMSPKESNIGPDIPTPSLDSGSSYYLEPSVVLSQTHDSLPENTHHKSLMDPSETYPKNIPPLNESPISEETSAKAAFDSVTRRDKKPAIRFIRLDDNEETIPKQPTSAICELDSLSDLSIEDNTMADNLAESPGEIGDYEKLDINASTNSEHNTKLQNTNHIYVTIPELVNSK